MLRIVRKVEKGKQKTALRKVAVFVNVCCVTNLYEQIVADVEDAGKREVYGTLLLLVFKYGGGESLTMHVCESGGDQMPHVKIRSPNLL